MQENPDVEKAQRSSARQDKKADAAFDESREGFVDETVVNELEPGTVRELPHGATEVVQESAERGDKARPYEEAMDELADEKHHGYKDPAGGKSQGITPGRDNPDFEGKATAEGRDKDKASTPKNFEGPGKEKRG